MILYEGTEDVLEDMHHSARFREPFAIGIPSGYRIARHHRLKSDVGLSHHGGMRFVLTYASPLAPNGTPQEKHRIRQALLPQLRRQWDIDPALKNIAHSGSEDKPGQGTRLDDIARRFTKAGFRFVPLVSNEFNLACQLQITLLRNEEPGNVLQTGGDIDNRLKTLFDSLSVPAHEQQIKKLSPAAGEDPFYCLLEDDSLVSGVEINTERLLEPLGNSQHVRLTITAIVRPTKITIDSLGFLGGLF